ncbi:11566_t:CDS:1, partial [Racocetra fulgida]
YYELNDNYVNSADVFSKSIEKDCKIPQISALASHRLMLYSMCLYVS